MIKGAKREPGRNYTVISLLLVLGALSLLVFTGGCFDEIISETPGEEDMEDAEEEEVEDEDPAADGEEIAEAENGSAEPAAEEEPDDAAGGEEISPDYGLLEQALLAWLQDKTGDEDVIMVHTDELEDTEAFFERYDLAEDNVIVYLVQSTENGKATVLFGLPYSEWTMKTVFSWDGEGWVFQQEEEIQMGGSAWSFKLVF